MHLGLRLGWLVLVLRLDVSVIELGVKVGIRVRVRDASSLRNACSTKPATRLKGNMRDRMVCSLSRTRWAIETF